MNSTIEDTTKLIKLKLSELFDESLFTVSNELEPVEHVKFEIKHIELTIIDSKIIISSEKVNSEYDLLEDESLNNFTDKVMKDLILFLSDANLRYINPDTLFGGLKRKIQSFFN